MMYTLSVYKFVINYSIIKGFIFYIFLSFMFLMFHVLNRGQWMLFVIDPGGPRDFQVVSEHSYRFRMV
ncbi:hypothetical protein HanIR_Chr11g0537101 [Helianthus annuus]|nr:hypothetical protein HanIR_Chr11g0537101 [Helianthus annuus]